MNLRLLPNDVVIYIYCIIRLAVSRGKIHEQRSEVFTEVKKRGSKLVKEAIWLYLKLGIHWGKGRCDFLFSELPQKKNKELTHTSLQGRPALVGQRFLSTMTLLN